jgi:hypothetical protein
MAKALDKIMDALDIETYLVCESEKEGKLLVQQLGEELNLGDLDIMFEEYDGYGMRVRLRKYVYKPGTKYNWLSKDE